MKKLSIFLLVFFGSVSISFGGIIIINTGVWGDAGNTASYNIETGILSDNILPHDQDAFVRTDGTSLYIIESGMSAIIKCDLSAVSADNVIYHYSVGEGTYPYDMVFFDSKAYVIMNVSNTIQVINPNAENEEAFKIGEIDISQWSDGDGFPDAVMGFAYDGMLFVVLQRVGKGWPLSNYDDSVIIKINPSTDEIIDLDPITDGIQGVKLILKNPQKGSLVGSKLYLGCTTYGVEAGGVMSIDLSDPTGTQTVLLNEDDLGDEIIFGINVFSEDFGLVYTLNDSWYAGVPRVFNPQDGTLGNELPVPDSGGGIAMSGGKLFIGVRDINNPCRSHFDYLTNSQSGLKLRALENFYIKCNYGDITRIPSLYELFGDRGGTLSNPDLKPEHIYKWDAGCMILLKKNLFPINGSFECAYFENNYKDLIQWYSTDAGFIHPDNVSGSYVKGTEIVWNTRLLNHLIYSGSWTFQNSEVISEKRKFYRNKQLPNRPKNFGSMKLEYPLKNTALFWTLNRKSTYYLDRTNQNHLLYPGRTLHDLGISVSYMGGKTIFTLLAKNITDVHTFDVKNMPKPGRSYMVSIVYSLN